MAKIMDSFACKITWFAIKNVDIHTICLLYPNLINICDISWEKGLALIEHNSDKILVSGKYDGWSFLVGKGLCDPSQSEKLIALLLKFGEVSEEVYYFSSHRIVATYGFAKVIRGKIVRLYCYSGECGCVYKNIGEKTREEKELNLNLASNEDELYTEGFNEIDETHIIELAERWSLAPDMLIGMEEEKSLIADIIT